MLERPVVLLVRDLFLPVNNFPIERFLNGDVRHCDRRTGAMPMLLSGFEPDDISRPDFFDGTAPFLSPADAGSHDQRLAERMRMPGGSCAGLKGNACAARTRGIGRLK